MQSVLYQNRDDMVEFKISFLVEISKMKKDLTADFLYEIIHIVELIQR